MIIPFTEMITINVNIVQRNAHRAPTAEHAFLAPAIRSV